MKKRKKYNINITLSEFNEVIAVFDKSTNVIDIDLTINRKENIIDVLNKKYLLNLIKENLKSRGKEFILNSEIEAIYIIMRSNNSIIKNAHFSIHFDEKIGEFIKNNPFLQNHPLTIIEKFDINKDDLNRLLIATNEYKNIEIKLNGNKNIVSIDKYKKTVNAIENIITKIKKYNLSPIEQIMYAYDLIRERIYQKEDKDEDVSESRDITSVLLGNKIVCVGYSVIFEKVLSSLGIKNQMCSLKNKNIKCAGHRRNVAYIKDDKYNIEGVYYFDLTWDSKKSNDDKNYLNSYRFFCCIKDDIERYTNNQFKDTLFDGLTDSTIWKFESYVNEVGIEQVPKDMIYLLNNIANFIDNKNVINPLITLTYHPFSQSLIKKFDLEKTMKQLNRYQELFFYNEISAPQLMSILYNVRKIEYMEEPGKYPFDTESFKTVLVDDLDDIEDSLEARFKTCSKEEFERESSRQQLPLKIETVKFVKLLQITHQNNFNK